jgi:hypothetical protein
MGCGASLIPHVWTEKDSDLLRNELTASVRLGRDDAVATALNKMPFGDDDKASILGLQNPKHGALVVALAIPPNPCSINPNKFIVKMIMTEINSLPPGVQIQLLSPAAQRDGNVLEHASSEIKENETIVMAAVKQNGRALRHASDELRCNEAIVMAALRQDGDAFKHVHEEMRSNRATVMVAVRLNGLALEHASVELRNDEPIVMAAVQQKGDALEFASEKLRNSRSIVLAAVQNYGPAFEHATLELRSDEAFVLMAVQQDGRALLYAVDRMRGNEMIVLAAVQEWAERCTRDSSCTKDHIFKSIHTELQRKENVRMVACI